MKSGEIFLIKDDGQLVMGVRSCLLTIPLLRQGSCPEIAHTSA
jgi:hypothetical protein